MNANANNANNANNAKNAKNANNANNSEGAAEGKPPQTRADLAHNLFLQTLFSRHMAEAAAENRQDRNGNENENESRLLALATRMEINRVQLEQTHNRMTQLASLAHQHRYTLSFV